MRPRLAALLALLAALCTGAALAAGVTERTRTAVVPSFDSNHVTARCGASQGLALGGFKAQTRRSKGLVVNRFRPAGSRAFSVGCHERVRERRGHLRDRLLRPAATVEARDRERGDRMDSLPGIPPAALWHSCPPGTSVRLGGFQADVSPQPSGPAIVVDTSSAPGSGLSVSGTNGGPQKGTLKAFAECGPGPKLTAVKKTVALPDGGGRKAATARCPHRGRLVFGGFVTSSYDGNGPYISQLRRTMPGRWRAGAFQFPRTGGRLTAIAYCGPAPAPGRAGEAARGL